MMVLSRCAMITAVRPRRISCMFARMLLSDCVSSADVASSNTSRRGSWYSARAMHRRWICPPESPIPRSPTTCS
ncbi:hypothetical protein D3C72_1953060 [compost metagenome]